MKIDRCITAALDYVNDERAKTGRPLLDELPKGVPGSYTDCPIARGCDRPLSLDEIIEMPPGVYEFTKGFDKGYIPELIDRVAAYPD